MGEKLLLGLDIGSNSVGWSVVDENNQLVKKNGKTLWGVRMFEEASNAQKRRAFRSSRIRLKRRNERMKLLRVIFKNEIEKVDPDFYERLDDSFFKTEDKRHKNKNNLFVGEFSDKEFFNKFPTIYHLRSFLLNSNKKEDIRFIYLAIANMVKHRGNFLRPEDEFNPGDSATIGSFFDSYNDLVKELSNSFEDYADYFEQIEVTGNEHFFEMIEEIMKEISTKNDKKKKLKEAFQSNKGTLTNDYLIPLLVGGKLNLSGLKPVKDFGYEKCEVTVITETLDELISDKKGKVSELDPLLDFLLQIKEVVDFYYVKKLLKDSTTLSEAMIKKYDEHKKDLKCLKGLVKKYLPSEYNALFREFGEKAGKTDKETKSSISYANYISMNSVGGKTTRIGHANRESFYSNIKTLLSKITEPDQEDLTKIDEIMLKIENNDYLPRQNSNQNGALPMQLNLSEINKILNIQKEFYPFLGQVDSESGLTGLEKIVSIFKFRVPYYVGHLSTVHKNSWIKRTDERIYPWNLEKVVDIDKTAEEFIHRMQRKCTYLNGEEDYCLPKNSLAFSEYNCLSYLNKLSINGAPIPLDIKRAIYKNVFLKTKKPTIKSVIHYIKCNYGDSEIKTSNLKDLPEINCDMSSYIIFKDIFKRDFEKNYAMIEDIIKDIVVFSDKSILRKRLESLYKLDDERVRDITSLNFSGYSNLCRNLLCNIEIIDPSTGEIYGSVLDIMRNTNATLQQIMYDPMYRLIDIVDRYNSENSIQADGLSLEEFIDSSIFVSPIMKRPMIQAYRIIEEIEKIMGRPIDEYYIETTRENNRDKKWKKKPTNSRYSSLKSLYENSKDMMKQLSIDYNYINKLLDENKNRLRSDAIYLYFTQLGKCMYTLENIDLDTLLSGNNKYDIDHIYPQALIKDDSLSNRVLTNKGRNSTKSESFIFEIDGFLNSKCFDFYQMLLEAKLITREKYNRLTKKEIHPAELEGFVNRQIVATNQAVIGLINLLKYFKKVDTQNIIYSKAENITMARQLFDIPKSREANNFHHAHDAYLNVVIGGTLHKYYSYHRLVGYKDFERLKTEKVTINPERILKAELRTYKGQVIWDKVKTIGLLKKNIFERYDVMETVRTYNPGSLFSKTTVLPASSGNLISIKSNGAISNTNKYGGYTSYSYSKFVIIKITQNKKTAYSIEAIPKMYENRVEEYLRSVVKTDFEVCLDNIKVNVVVKKGRLKYCITGKTGPSLYIKNLNDRYFGYRFIEIVKKIEKYFANKKNSVEMPESFDRVTISPKGIRGDEIVVEVKEVVDLIRFMVAKFKLPIYSFSVLNSVTTSIENYDLDSMSIVDLLKLAKELLIILKTNERKAADLSVIGLAKNSAILKCSAKLSPGTEIIAESITGYYSKVLFVVPC